MCVCVCVCVCVCLTGRRMEKRLFALPEVGKEKGLPQRMSQRFPIAEWLTNRASAFKNMDSVSNLNSTV